MKVLIVEDERYIREGIVGLLEWTELGIGTLETASNGEKGLEKARQIRPDIILSDIKMPRMTGIELAEQYLKIDPDCCVVFMSAYSDIVYYRAAIKMKVMDFLEKPVKKKTLQDVVCRAVKEREQRLEQYIMHQHYKRSELNFALKDLILPNREALAEELFAKNLRQDLLGELTHITVAVIKTQMLIQEVIGKLEQRFYSGLLPVVGRMKGEILWRIKGEKYLVFAFFSRKEELSLNDRRFLSECFVKLLKDVPICYITWGKTVKGIAKAHESYQTAAWQMQKSFFETSGTVSLCADGMKNCTMENYQKAWELIVNAIEELNREEIFKEEQALYEMIKKKKNAYIQNVRNIYWSFYYTLYRQTEILHLKLEDEKNALASSASWKQKSEEFNLDELHGFFVMQINRFFTEREERIKEQPAVMAVKQYIEENYRDPLLSLKEISDYVHISTSRLCTIFKMETGITINKYLTETRLKRAKKYLKSSRYNVADICLMAGYKDSSYFGKIFRRYFHMSPLEYRDQWLQR